MKNTYKQERGPSKASLREIPEVRLDKAKVFRNPYAARIAAEGMTLPGGVHIPGRSGRPKKGQEVGPSIPRSVRFPTQVWERLEKAAKAKGLTLHAALRTAIVEWAGRDEPR